VRAAAALLAGLLALGCGGWRPFARAGAAPGADLSRGIEWVDEGAVVEFYERASAFYARLAQRRFDTISTYQDDALRGYFASEAAFADYYADLTGALVEAHFEKNRPLTLEVLEMRLEGPGRARVETRMVGEDGRPLRPGHVRLDRIDRWQRSDGVWRIEPGKG
jgi:hypothetical protein